MSLKLYNTLTRRKEEFSPIDPANVRLYACGPTVYDYLHIGNGRMLIVFDVLFRLLRHLYGPEHVTYARNITDVEDKINERAARDFPDLPLNDAIAKLTADITRIFHEDAAALGCLPPTVEPRATGHIPEMRTIIEKLIAAGVAYVAEGHVLFQVAKMDGSGGLPKYGALARRSLDDMIAGARVEVAPYKRDPMDFVLWKPSAANEPGWPSPAGIATPGRPGWHIECSAMSWKHLGETFDIHGGGIDLVFPHHENEVAQSCGAFGTPTMAKVWMHNGFLQVEGEKMSKSLGNFVTIRDQLRDWNGEAWSFAAIRLNMLRTHYRQPIDWTYDALTNSKADIHELALGTSVGRFQTESAYLTAWEAQVAPSSELLEALSDDLNTAEATTILLSRISDINKLDDTSRIALVHDSRFLNIISSGSRDWLTGSIGMHQMALSKIGEAASQFRSYRVMRANGLRDEIERLERWFSENEIKINDESQITYHGNDPTKGEIERKIAGRLAARVAKNWGESDRIRDELAAMRIALKDNKDGTTTWEFKR